MTTDDWFADAACSGAPTDLWFPFIGNTGGGVAAATARRVEAEAAAKAVCAECPVRAECLEHAITHQERFGIWGGLNPVERQLGVPVPDGVTQRQLAARLGVNQRTVQGWLSGRAEIPAAHTDALRAALIEAAS